MPDEANLTPGDIVAIIEPRVEEVDPKTRTCTGRLQAFRIAEHPSDTGQFQMVTTTGENPTKFLRLPGGYRLG